MAFEPELPQNAEDNAGEAQRGRIIMLKLRSGEGSVTHKQFQCADSSLVLVTWRSSAALQKSMWREK